RSLWDIVTSCFVTLFTCTWTAVHPDIPHWEEGVFAITLHRFCLMLVAPIAPELLVAWALRQSLAARDIEKDCRSHRWPVNSQITDKLDLVMFGHLDVDTENGCGGDMANVKLLRNSGLKLMDFSHGWADSFFTSTIHHQLAWFVIQLGVRIVYQLPTTQLEINTLSVTTISLVAYCCWWKKPKDVRQPYHVHW
ncbi:hypothetical protein P692DRAFT_20669930, partial [Suillus brevipes Sb2]